MAGCPSTNIPPATAGKCEGERNADGSSCTLDHAHGFPLGDPEKIPEKLSVPAFCSADPHESLQPHITAWPASPSQMHPTRLQPACPKMEAVLTAVLSANFFSPEEALNWPFRAKESILGIALKHIWTTLTLR